MEELYSRIINHIILKLKNGETNLSKVLMVKELDISVSKFNDTCEKKQMPKFLFELDVFKYVVLVPVLSHLICSSASLKNPGRVCCVVPLAKKRQST